MTEKPNSGRGQRELRVRVKTAKGRKLSSTLWLERQLNDPYVIRARKEGYRGRAAYKILELDDNVALVGDGRGLGLGQLHKPGVQAVQGVVVHLSDGGGRQGRFGHDGSPGSGRSSQRMKKGGRAVEARPPSGIGLDVTAIRLVRLSKRILDGGLVPVLSRRDARLTPN